MLQTVSVLYLIDHQLSRVLLTSSQLTTLLFTLDGDCLSNLSTPFVHHVESFAFNMTKHCKMKRILLFNYISDL